MSQNQSLEDVMQRIRSRVDGRNAGSPRYGSQIEAESMKAVQKADPPRLQIQPNDLSPLRGEIAVAIEGTRRVGQINPRNPGLHNAAIQFVKKAMRRSLTWYTRPLHYFQGGVIRALQQIEQVLAHHEQSIQREVATLDSEICALNDQVALMDRNVAAFGRRTAVLEVELNHLRSNFSASRSTYDEKLDQVHADLNTSLGRTQLIQDEKLSQTQADFKIKLARVQSIQEERLSQMHASYGRQLADLGEAVASVRAGVAQIGESLRETQSQGRLRDRDTRRMFHRAANAESDPTERNTNSATPPMFPSEIKQEIEFDYFAFEDRYRGDEILIRQRQKEYLEYFGGRENVLDVGCGRGEFLELLRDKNISAKGVELGTDQYLLCKEKGLDVVQQDLFTYLESLPDESLGGLFSAQVIEHLTASDQLRYVTLAYRKTKSGSPVIFETINAQCVWAVMRNFFLDPTHVRPVHPETLKFAMESAHFKNIVLLYSSPMVDHQIPALACEGDARNVDEFNRQLRKLNELLYGPQDYAAIGWH